MSDPSALMTLWDQQMVFLLDRSLVIYGKPTIYQRPGYPAFALQGVPEFLSRLQDVNRGQFISVSYRLSDFVTATFHSFVTATFTGAPNSNGTLTFDGIGYTSHMQADINDAVPYQFWRGTNGSTAAANLAACINASSPQVGIYSAATTHHPTCTAFNDTGSPSVRVEYNLPGTVGDNVIAAQDAMSFVTLDSTQFYGGGPLLNDLVKIGTVLYRVSDLPAGDSEGAIELRLEKKAL
jgi:hypothetical protein